MRLATRLRPLTTSISLGLLKRCLSDATTITDGKDTVQYVLPLLAPRTSMGKAGEAWVIVCDADSWRLKMAWHLSIVMPPMTWREPFWREDSPTLQLNKETFGSIMIAMIMQSLRLMALRYIPRMPYTGVQIQIVAQTNNKSLGTDTYINPCIPRIGFPRNISVLRQSETI